MRKTPLQLLVQERTGRQLEDLLLELYVAKRHTDQEIATALSTEERPITRATVQMWREQLGITADARTPLPSLVGPATATESSPMGAGSPASPPDGGESAAAVALTRAGRPATG